MSARRYGSSRKVRRGVAGTAVAAAAMAALGASQAPGFLPVAHAATQDQQQAQSAAPPDSSIDGDSPYVTALPPLNSPAGPLAPTPGTGSDTSVTVPGGGASLPTTVLAAYERAQSSVGQTDPGCHLPWQLLAAIGQVESGQARGGAVDANGTTYKPILGPVLNGNGFANISDTDNGQYDGDPVHDRAVGPMQFIPSTWRTWGADGNGDGVKDPNNVYDAALAAAHYLCADGRDLAVPADMDRAILGYNHSQDYLNLVMSWYEHFRQGGAVSVPDRSGSVGPGIKPPAVTPASPNPTPSGTASPTPSPTKSVSGSVGPTSPGGSSSPTSSPTGGQPTTPPSGDPTTTPPTTPPSDDPTTPGCPTDSTTPTPTDSGTATPTPTDSGTTSPTPDPCDTSGTTTPTPDPTDTAGAATGAGLSSS
ncbi:Membrane-bound lytic murein transglycosylase B [Actinacidiphila yanglinensis]|uniref:Membrane-bound lytic murein transglycosylase B n=1 Tax=Actinacidiphila yanglinensis TaxID=310779 RepID=A0A1H5TS15_9ACTN|nr:lytic transglycosylase domain-containing protein [Actinacidiphila yanglinensis]SEF65559.1 Membrane-bound lytic murein transglycosylase B [Actinacidiphila yanglinensis]